MITHWLRAALILIAASLFTLGILQAAPYDDGGLTLALTDPACAAPCFMGIQPGTTLFADAVALLESHPWVGEVNANTTYATWTWSGSQPAFLQIDPDDQVFSRILSFQGIVTWIGFMTNIPAGAFRITLGVPERTYAAQWDIRRTQGTAGARRLVYSVLQQQRVQFDAADTEITIGVECPPRPDFWRVPAYLSMPIRGASARDELREDRVERAFAQLPQECR